MQMQCDGTVKTRLSPCCRLKTIASDVQIQGKGYPLKLPPRESGRVTDSNIVGTPAASTELRMTFWPVKLMTNPGANPGQSQSHVSVAGLSRVSVAEGLEGRDFLYLGFLAVTAIWIWIRDLAWLSAADETLPILAALPLFIWLGSPWRFRQVSLLLPRLPLLGVALLAAAGLVLDMTLLLASAWTFALWIWIKARVAGETCLLRRLAVLPFLAFPWIALDLTPLGWQFRLSAAWVADHAYAALGFSVVREGTMLLVRNIPIEVAAPCSGMNSLQAILLGGLVLTWMEFGRSRWYWWLVASLPVLAWFANTVRVCSIIATAIGVGPEAARGSLHQICDWAVVLLVVGGWSMAVRWLLGTRLRRKFEAL